MYIFYAFITYLTLESAYKFVPKNPAGIFDLDYTESPFRRMVILTVLSLPISEHGLPFLVFSSLISLSSICSV